MVNTTLLLQRFSDLLQGLIIDKCFICRSVYGIRIHTSVHPYVRTSIRLLCQTVEIRAHFILRFFTASDSVQLFGFLVFFVFFIVQY